MHPLGERSRDRRSRLLGFHDRQEYVDAALEYLTDGLRHGQRLAYVGSEPVAEQRERLDPLGDVGAMIDAGKLQLLELGDLYEVGAPVEAEAQLAVYGGATEAALATGYTGLRVAAQVTDLVADPATWDAHVRWESVADQAFASKSLSALCGYDRGVVPPQLLAELAAVHPAANEAAGAVPFHLFGEGGELVLSGEVDYFSSGLFDRSFGFASDAEGAVSLNLEALEFIDHRGLEVLAAHTRRLAVNGGCTVSNPPPVVERLCELLELEL